MGCKVCGEPVKRKRNSFCSYACSNKGRDTYKLKKIYAAIGGKENFSPKKFGSASKLYGAWASMFKRCYNKNHEFYHRYGGRGIAVSKGWHEYSEFLKWAIPTWKSGLSLDRIDNDGNYAPDNCRWVDQKTQTRNTCRTKLNSELVSMMRHLRKRGFTARQLSKLFKYHVRGIYMICDERKVWA